MITKKYSTVLCALICMSFLRVFSMDVAIKNAAQSLFSLSQYEIQQAHKNVSVETNPFKRYEIKENIAYIGSIIQIPLRILIAFNGNFCYIPTTDSTPNIIEELTALAQNCQTFPVTCTTLEQRKIWLEENYNQLKRIIKKLHVLSTSTITAAP